MTPEEQSLRDAFLDECWRPVKEIPREIREAQRKADRAQQRALEEMALEAVHNPSTSAPHLPTCLSTDCAQNGSGRVA